MHHSAVRSHRTIAVSTPASSNASFVSVAATTRTKVKPRYQSAFAADMARRAERQHERLCRPAAPLGVERTFPGLDETGLLFSAG